MGTGKNRSATITPVLSTPSAAGGGPKNRHKMDFYKSEKPPNAEFPEAERMKNHERKG
jgi:hypothetical protein